MLACVRQTARRLPRPAFFSTSAALALSPPSKKHGVNNSLTRILDQQSLNRSPVTAVELKHTMYPVYRVFHAGEPLLPNDLVYKNALAKPKVYRKQGVAPGHEITHRRDTFYQFGLDPRHFTNNGAVLSHFVTEMGKIKSRDQTHLTLKSQRLIGRTIRRAKMMGIIPTLSKGYKRSF